MYIHCDNQRLSRTEDRELVLTIRMDLSLYQYGTLDCQFNQYSVLILASNRNELFEQPRFRGRDRREGF